jgi:hypothetical protein
MWASDAGAQSDQVDLLDCVHERLLYTEYCLSFVVTNRYQVLAANHRPDT